AAGEADRRAQEWDITEAVGHRAIEGAEGGRADQLEQQVRFLSAVDRQRLSGAGIATRLRRDTVRSRTDPEAEVAAGIGEHGLPTRADGDRRRDNGKTRLTIGHLAGDRRPTGHRRRRGTRKRAARTRQRQWDWLRRRRR